MQVNLDSLQNCLNEPIIKAGQKHGFLFIVTPASQWLVKPIRNTERVLWWQQTDRLIRQRGFRSMPDFFVWQNDWLVIRYIPGRTAQYGNVRDLQQCVALLAHFHLVSRHVSETVFFDSMSTLDNRLVNRFEQYEHVYHQLSNFPQLVSMGEEFRRLGERALSRIDRKALQSITRSDIAQRAVAHRDLASHNILINLEGKPWLIDFETVGFDAQLGDLWQMASRTLVEWHWSPNVFVLMLHTYESIRPLSTEERTILSQLFLFPNDFYREVLGLLKHKSRFPEHKVIPYLQMVNRDRRQWYAFLEWLGVAW